MSISNKRAKEDLSLFWWQLPISAAVLCLSALLFLALHKNDFAAWLFLEILSAIGCIACIVLSVKTRKNYLLASKEETSKRVPILSFLLTGITICASVVIFIITWIAFIA